MNMTVIVGVDSSEASKAALRLAAQEARWRQASLVAVSAYELPLGPVGGFPGGAMHTKGEEQATVEAELRATVDHELCDEAGQTKVRVSAGLAGQVIIEAAGEAQAELIVLAAHPGGSSSMTTSRRPGSLTGQCAPTRIRGPAAVRRGRCRRCRRPRARTPGPVRSSSRARRGNHRRGRRRHRRR